ncbi:MAG: DUF2059 domain-containing protein [Burkholderiales bacterium]|nr:DUF2059 domain-containing protein [Burkholderiales bacterium]
MKLCQIVLFAAALLAEPAQAAAPTEASIKEIFVLTNTQGMLKNIDAQLVPIRKKMFEEATKNTPQTQEREQAIDRFLKKTDSILKETINWDVLEPKFVDIYSQSLSQEEVDGIIAFYKSPAGQAFIKKMPVLTHNSLVMRQKMMVPMMQKMQIAVKELQEEMDKINHAET